MTREKAQRVVVAAVDDLFFLAKIGSVAARLPLSLIEARDTAELAAKLAEVTPDLVILDLNSAPCEPLKTIHRIKEDPRFAGTRLIGFLSHVQRDMQEQALKAGCDSVLPRSRFSAQLAEILAGNVES
jgi:CheY-like chemotaxis protein